MLYKFWQFIFFAQVLLFLKAPDVLAQASKPNIILILSDDVSYKNLGCNGGTYYKTPNLDNMAAKGMRFTNCHASPLCSPSRQSLLTGKYNFRNYFQWGVLNQTERTIGNLMSDAGYQTACFGKWQFDGGENSIKKFGFNNYCVWQPYQVELPEVRIYKNPLLYTNGSFIPESQVDGKYGEDIFTDSVLNFIDRNVNRPFFIYYPMVLAHNPFQPTPDDPAYATWDVKKEDTTYYASMMHYMDKKVGEIIQKVENLGLQNNTIILFLGDNGTPSQIIESINDGDDNSMLAGGKGTTTDRGTHVPFLAYCPGTIEPGSVNNTLVSFTDFLPTIAKLTGSTPDSSLTEDGVDFSSSLISNQAGSREWIFDYYNAFLGKSELSKWVQNASYKLYSYHGKLIFYDLNNDILEEHPLPTSTLNQQEKHLRKKFADILDYYTGICPPELINPIVNHITDTSALFTATILQNEGLVEVDEKGTCFSEEGGKLFNNSLLVNSLSKKGTETGQFSQERQGLVPQKRYFYKAYAKNSYGTGVSPIIGFFTLSKKVVAAPRSFEAKACPQSINLTWSKATFPSTGATVAGYLLLHSQEMPELIAEPNGLPPSSVVSKGAVLLNSTAKLPAEPITIAKVEGLTEGETHNFLLVPYTWDGKHEATYHYFVDGAKVAQAITGRSIYCNPKPDDPSSTDTTTKFAFKISPNPFVFEGMLSVKTTSTEHITIIINDAYGRVISKCTTTNKELRIGKSLAPGVYFVSVFQGKLKMIQRLVKSR